MFDLMLSDLQQRNKFLGEKLLIRIFLEDLVFFPQLDAEFELLLS